MRKESTNPSPMSIMLPTNGSHGNGLHGTNGQFREEESGRQTSQRHVQIVRDISGTSDTNVKNMQTQTM